MNDKVHINDKERFKALLQLQQDRDYVSSSDGWTPVPRGSQYIIDTDYEPPKKKSKTKRKSSKAKRTKGNKIIQQQPSPG